MYLYLYMHCLHPIKTCCCRLNFSLSLSFSHTYYLSFLFHSLIELYVNVLKTLNVVLFHYYFYFILFRYSFSFSHFSGFEEKYKAHVFRLTTREKQLVLHLRLTWHPKHKMLHNLM